MSEVPTTPPEITSTENTPLDSLLARLRKITGVIAPPVPPEDPPEKAAEWTCEGAPPVDRLIPVIRDCFAALAAGGIAVGVVAAAGAIVLWGYAKAGTKRVRLWQREMFERLAAVRARRAERALRPEPEPVAPEIRTDEVQESPATPEIVAAEALTPAAPVDAVPPEAAQRRVLRFFRGGARTAEPEAGNVTAVSASAVLEPESLMAETIKEPVVEIAAPVRARPARRFRLAVISAALVLLMLPALWLVKPVRYFITSLMGRGNAAVIVAGDGWLFPRVESEPAATPPTLRETAVALRANGAALVVVSVPAKSAVYPEKLTGSGDSELQRQPQVVAALKELTDTGAQVLDLGPVLHGLKTSDASEGFVFAPQSALWTPRGMAQSAFAAAGFIQQQPGYADLPLQPSLAVMVPATGAATQEDLVTALESPRIQSRYTAQTVPLIRLLTAAKKEPLASDPASPVVLLGDRSVSLYDDPALGHPGDGLPPGQPISAGFAQHLAWHLSTALEVHTAGSGQAAAKDWLAAKPEAERKSKRLIVWVLADAELLR